MKNLKKIMVMGIFNVLFFLGGSHQTTNAQEISLKPVDEGEIRNVFQLASCAFSDPETRQLMNNMHNAVNNY